MPIRFECPGCGAALKLKEEYSGRRIKCPQCETINRVPAEDDEWADVDEVVSSTRSSSRTPPPRQTRRSELPPPSNRKKKKAPQKSNSGSGGSVPVLAIVAGFSLLAGVFGVIAFIFIKPLIQSADGQVADGGQAGQAKIVQAHLDGPGAKFRVKFELPPNWTSEGSIEHETFPWANMKGEGQSIEMTSNKSLLGGADAMTAIGGLVESLKTSHTSRGIKLKAESTDWEESQLSIHEGKRGPVIWSDYEYKGLLGKKYGIRCTVEGPLWPCNLMLECGQSARDKWRPTLLAIAESIHYVAMEDGKEVQEDFGIALDDEMPDVDEAVENADPEEMP